MRALWNTWVVRYDLPDATFYVGCLSTGEWVFREDPAAASVFGSREAAKQGRTDFELEHAEDAPTFPHGRIILRRGLYNMSFEQSGGVPPIGGDT